MANNYPRSCIHNELPAHTDEGSSKMVVDLENVKTILKMVIPLTTQQNFNDGTFFWHKFLNSLQLHQSII